MEPRQPTTKQDSRKGPNKRKNMHSNLHIHKESNFLETFSFYDKTAPRVLGENKKTGKRNFGLAKEVTSEMQISDT